MQWQIDLHGAENVLYNIFQDPKKFSKKNILKFPTYRQISLLTVLVTDSVWVNQLVWIGFSLDINLHDIEIRKKYQESQHRGKLPLFTDYEGLNLSELVFR